MVGISHEGFPAPFSLARKDLLAAKKIAGVGNNEDPVILVFPNPILIPDVRIFENAGASLS